MARLTVEGLQANIGVESDGIFGRISKAALLRTFTSHTPAPLTEADYADAAARLGVPVGHIKGVRKVEAPRGAFDAQGRPSLLFERHKFRNHSLPVGRFNSSHPDLSGGPYGPGGYGSYSAQYDKLAAACALDPEAAFRACSWGAFQVLGENAEAMDYPSAYDMAHSLVHGEKAHLETFMRFLKMKRAEDEFRACRPGNPNSCIPFVTLYNGTGFRQYSYHEKLAAAI